MSFLVELGTILRCLCGWEGRCKDLKHDEKGVIILAQCPKCGRTLTWQDFGNEHLVPENATVLPQA